ncbi:MAG: polysaccharide deacetylase family protein [Desulfovibrio sp.]|nr:polysaccharide deacetylase family protein [Desulfovibrio sp.]
MFLINFTAALYCIEMKKFFFLPLFWLAYASCCYAYSANDFLHEMDEPGLCALTFDDGPSRFTGHLLDMMAAEDVKATFFVLGENVLHFSAMVIRQRNEGHEVASHGWSHPNLGRASKERVRSEIMQTNAVLEQLGIKPKFFRPPYGSFTPYVETVTNEHGMEIALWTHDSRDWKRLPKSYAAIAPCQRAEHRHGVFLFHDIHERTVNDFPRIVRELRASGCRRFVTLSEYMEHMKKPKEIPAPQLYVCHMREYCLPAHAAHVNALTSQRHIAHEQNAMMHATLDATSVHN